MLPVIYGGRRESVGSRSIEHWDLTAAIASQIRLSDSRCVANKVKNWVIYFRRVTLQMPAVV